MKIRDVMTADVVSVDKDDRLSHALSLMRRHRLSKLAVLDLNRYYGVLTDGAILDVTGSLHASGLPAESLHVSAAVRRDAPVLSHDGDVAPLLRIATGEDLGMFPVVEADRVVGVVTKADLLRFVDAPVPVADVMHREVVAVAPDDRVAHARRLMVDRGVERLPVLAQGRLRGIVGELDLALGIQSVKHAGGPSHEAARLRALHVSDVMTRRVVTAEPWTSVAEAARLLRERDVGGLPVVEPGTDRIAGFLTRTDLLRTVDVASIAHAPARRA